MKAATAQPTRAEALDLEIFSGCYSLRVPASDLQPWRIDAGDVIVYDPRRTVPKVGQKVVVLMHRQSVPRLREVWQWSQGQIALLSANGSLEYLPAVRVLGILVGVVRRFE